MAGKKDSGKTDGNPFMDMFQNFGNAMNIPQPDLGAIMDIHRKNLQALQEAVTLGSQTSQELMARQRDSLEKSLADIANAVQDMKDGGSDPAKLMTTQMEIAKTSLETAIKNATEMSQVVQQGSTDAFAILKDRVMESISELTEPRKS